MGKTLFRLQRKQICTSKRLETQSLSTPMLAFLFSLSTMPKQILALQFILAALALEHRKFTLHKLFNPISVARRTNYHGRSVSLIDHYGLCVNGFKIMAGRTLFQKEVGRVCKRSAQYISHYSNS